MGAFFQFPVEKKTKKFALKFVQVRVTGATNNVARRVYTVKETSCLVKKVVFTSDDDLL